MPLALLGAIPAPVLVQYGLASDPLPKALPVVCTITEPVTAWSALTREGGGGGGEGEGGDGDGEGGGGEGGGGGGGGGDGEGGGGGRGGRGGGGCEGGGGSGIEIFPSPGYEKK